MMRRCVKVAEIGKSFAPKLAAGFDDEISRIKPGFASNGAGVRAVSPTPCPEIQGYVDIGAWCAVNYMRRRMNRC